MMTSHENQQKEQPCQQQPQQQQKQQQQVAKLVSDIYANSKHHGGETEKEQEKQFKHKLVLHFDINETILIGDEAGGDSRLDSLNKMLAKSAFVQVPVIGSDVEKRTWSYEETSTILPTHWWDGTPLSSSTVQHHRRPTPPPSLFIGWNWPPNCVPYYRTSFKNVSKTFCQHHGAIYQGTLNYVVQEKLPPPQPTLEDPPHQHCPNSEGSSVLDHLLPSFFDTLIKLQQQQQQQQKESQSQPRDLTIVFRTFGTDLPLVARAMTLFAQGRHPKYPNFRNKAWEMSESCLYRGKWSLDQDAGNNNADADADADADDTTATSSEYVFQLYHPTNDTLVAANDEQVLQIIHSHSICGIQDDYPFWKDHNWEPWAGKPIWKLGGGGGGGGGDGVFCNSNNDDNDDTCDNVFGTTMIQHVLLDDNIHNLPHDSIASVRVAVPKQVIHDDDDDDDDDDKVHPTKTTWMFQTLHGPDILREHGRHLIRVPTIAPILQDDWFFQQIQNAQAAFVDE